MSPWSFLWTMPPVRRCPSHPALLTLSLLLLLGCVSLTAVTAAAPASTIPDIGPPGSGSPPPTHTYAVTIDVDWTRSVAPPLHTEASVQVRVDCTVDGADAWMCWCEFGHTRAPPTSLSLVCLIHLPHSPPHLPARTGSLPTATMAGFPHSRCCLCRPG